jgi:hypothetical protein
MAIHLAGPSSYNLSLILPPITPPHPGKLTCYNTMGRGGGEHIVACNVILCHIGKCLKVEAEHISRGKNPLPPTPLHHKRQSKCSSVRPVVVDNHKPPLVVSPITPILQMPALPLPTSETACDKSNAQLNLAARSPMPLSIAKDML